MYTGELAQMVERPFSMREEPGSIPGFSKEHKHIFATHGNIFLFSFLFTGLYSLLIYCCYCLLRQRFLTFCTKSPYYSLSAIFWHCKRGPWSFTICLRLRRKAKITTSRNERRQPRSQRRQINPHRDHNRYLFYSTGILVSKSLVISKSVIRSQTIDRER